MIYLNDKEVQDLLKNKWKEIITEVESAFIDSTSDMVPKIYLQAGSHGDYRAMPASLGEYASLKWIGVFPNNPKQKLPTTIGTFLLNDRYTGKQLIAMDCTSLTAYRTAATSAIAAKYCALSDVKSIAFIGCGKQAYYHALAYKEIFGDFRSNLYDKNSGSALNLSFELSKSGVRNYKICKDIKNAVEDSDIITTLTPSTRAYLSASHLKENCHVNAIGADAVGKRELMSNILKKASNVICDDYDQASHSGELQYNIQPSLKVLSLDEVIKDHRKLKLKEGISVFDSTGVAIEDIATGILVFKLYNNRQI